MHIQPFFLPTLHFPLTCPARPVLQLPAKVAVVGGSGFIGSALVKRLLAGTVLVLLTYAGYHPCQASDKVASRITTGFCAATSRPLSEAPCFSGQSPPPLLSLALPLLTLRA